MEAHLQCVNWIFHNNSPSIQGTSIFLKYGSLLYCLIKEWLKWEKQEHAMSFYTTRWLLVAVSSLKKFWKQRNKGWCIPLLSRGETFWRAWRGWAVQHHSIATIYQWERPDKRGLKRRKRERWVERLKSWVHKALLEQNSNPSELSDI